MGKENAICYKWTEVRGDWVQPFSMRCEVEEEDLLHLAVEGLEVGPLGMY